MRTLNSTCKVLFGARPTAYTLRRSWLPASSNVSPWGVLPPYLRAFHPALATKTSIRTMREAPQPIWSMERSLSIGTCLLSRLINSSIPGTETAANPSQKPSKGQRKADSEKGRSQVLPRILCALGKLLSTVPGADLLGALVTKQPLKITLMANMK